MKEEDKDRIASLEFNLQTMNSQSKALQERIADLQTEFDKNSVLEVKVTDLEEQLASRAAEDPQLKSDFEAQQLQLKELNQQVAKRDCQLG